VTGGDDGDDRVQVWVHPTWRFMGGEFDPETYRMGMGGYWAARVDRAIDEFDGDVAAVVNTARTPGRRRYRDKDADTHVSGPHTRIPYGVGRWDATYEDPGRGDLSGRAVRGLLARTRADGDRPTPPPDLDPGRIAATDFEGMAGTAPDRFDETVAALEATDPDDLAARYHDFLDGLDDVALAPDPAAVAGSYRGALHAAARARDDVERGVVEGMDDAVPESRLADAADAWVDDLGTAADERYRERVDGLVDEYETVHVAGGFYEGCQRRFVASLTDAVGAEVVVDAADSYVWNEARTEGFTSDPTHRAVREQSWALAPGSAARDGRLVDAVEGAYDDLDVTVDAAGEGVEPER
jgi:hypothetical protein